MKSLNRGGAVAKYYRNEVFWDNQELLINILIGTAIGVFLLFVLYWSSIPDQLYIQDFNY